MVVLLVIPRRLTALTLAVALGCAPATTTTPAGRPAPSLTVADAAFLDTLQRRTFDWFWDTTNPRNGLTPDRWPSKSFSSVAAVGFALTAYPIGVERGWVTRAQAAERTATTLRFFWRAPQGGQPAGVTGHHGFYYHFLDMETGHRFERVELSTIDTALLLAGMLACQQYFADDSPAEREIRALADSIYARVDWRWAQANTPLVSMGWHPERTERGGFIEHDWRGYNEGMLLYVLALGSPTYAIEPAAWARWTSTYRWAEYYGQPHVNFGPLFGHQYSHVWIDFRGIRDEYMRGRGIDYFENSRRATLAQRGYATENPNGWRDYGADIWGLTAVDGPKDTTVTIDGQTRRFFSYAARAAAAHELRDDGTIGPTAVGGSVPFAPDVTIRALRTMRARYGDDLFARYGFIDAFNPTFRLEGVVVGRGLTHGRVVPEKGWFDTDYLGIDQGPILAMIENHRRDFVWRLMRTNPHVIRGLCRAGFSGGWIEGKC